MNFSLDLFCLRAKWCGGNRLSARLRLLAFLLDDRFFHVAQLIFAEKHLLANEERRRAEGAPGYGIVGQIDQALLDVVLLGPRDQAINIDAGGFEGFPKSDSLFI